MTPFLILALSLLSPPCQEATKERVRNAVGTYVSPRTKPEERTRIVERLGAMGPAAVGFIQSIADDSGNRGALIPLRFLAAEVKVDLLRRLGDERGALAITAPRTLMATIEASERSLESILDDLRRQGLFAALVNPAEQEALAKLRFSASATNEPMEQILNRMFQKHRLDYYARGGVLVIASRSWLWGPPSPVAADAALQARVAEALGQLDSDLIDRRAAAERTFIDAGPAAIPILEKEQARAKGAKRERLEGLVDRIYLRHTPDRLHPPGAEPGLISEEAHDFQRATLERHVSISFFRPTPLSEIVARISEFSETPVALDPSLPAALSGRKLTLALDRVNVHEALEALVVPLGAAVNPEAGKLVIVPRP